MLLAQPRRREFGQCIETVASQASRMQKGIGVELLFKLRHPLLLPEDQRQNVFRVEQRVSSWPTTRKDTITSGENGAGPLLMSRGISAA